MKSDINTLLVANLRLLLIQVKIEWIMKINSIKYKKWKETYLVQMRQIIFNNLRIHNKT